MNRWLYRNPFLLHPAMQPKRWNHKQTKRSLGTFVFTSRSVPGTACWEAAQQNSLSQHFLSPERSLRCLQPAPGHQHPWPRAGTHWPCAAPPEAQHIAAGRCWQSRAVGCPTQGFDRWATSGKERRLWYLSASQTQHYCLRKCICNVCNNWCALTQVLSSCYRLRCYARSCHKLLWWQISSLLNIYSYGIP